MGESTAWHVGVNSQLNKNLKMPHWKISMACLSNMLKSTFKCPTGSSTKYPTVVSTSAPSFQDKACIVTQTQIIYVLPA